METRNPFQGEGSRNPPEGSHAKKTDVRGETVSEKEGEIKRKGKGEAPLSPPTELKTGGKKKSPDSSPGGEKEGKVNTESRCGGSEGRRPPGEKRSTWEKGRGKKSFGAKEGRRG